MRGPLSGLRINHFGLLLRDQSLFDSFSAFFAFFGGI